MDRMQTGSVPYPDLFALAQPMSCVTNFIATSIDDNAIDVLCFLHTLCTSRTTQVVPSLHAAGKFTASQNARHTLTTPSRSRLHVS